MCVAKKGLTIVELLVVIAILTVLAGIIFGIVGQPNESARKTACLSNLRQMRVALLLYESDSGGAREAYGPLPFYPPASGYLALRDNYIKDGEVLFCPTMPKGDRGKLGTTMLNFLDIDLLTSDGPAALQFREQYQRHNGLMPAVFCPVHDDYIHRNEERAIHPDFAHPVHLELRFDGSLYRGRSVLNRTLQPTFPVRGIQ